MINLIKKLITIFYNNRSFSQEGEDLVLRRIIRKSKGFYIDIGAHHPFRYSNTFLFYKLGWSGLNIDAMPGSMELFKKYRKRDINLEYGISNTEQELKYFIFNKPELNTFDESHAIEWQGKGNGKIKIIDTKIIKTKSIMKVLEDNLSELEHVDFLNIDVEGYDLEILKSFDFIKIKVDYIVIEVGACFVEDLLESDIHNYLVSKKFHLFSKFYNSALYAREDVK